MVAASSSIPRGPVAGQAPIESKPCTRVLLGFFQPNDVRSYLETIGAEVDSNTSSVHTIASAHVATLGARGETSVSVLTEQPHLDELRGEATFAEHAATAKSLRFAIVEVRKLVACQPRVDWDHVERLIPNVPQVGDLEGLLRFCLPLQRDSVAPLVQASFNPMTNTFGCVVDNADVRICAPIQGGQPGTGRSLMGFAIGPGLHQMSVMTFNDRHMLNNGYHRAVALARAGHERIPVILLEASEVGLAPPARPGMFSPPIIFGSSPPRIEDFLSPAAVDLTSRRTRLLFSVHAEVHPIVG